MKILELFEQTNPTLRMGSRGPEVGRLQTLLGITADKIFGNNTRQAVINFQKNNNLTDDGIVGPNTWRALLASGSATQASTTQPATSIQRPTQQRKDARQEPEFMSSLNKTANSVGVNVQDLLAVIKHESGFNPAARNPKTGASGLIQFMPDTAKGLGTSTDEILKMSGTEQVPLIQKFYNPYRGKLNSVEDLYMVTFLPAALDLDDNFKIGIKGSTNKIWKLSQDKLYTQNHVFDADKKGYYTVGDIKNRIRQMKMGMA